MKHFFLAHVYLDLQIGDQSAAIYSSLLEAGFANSTYLIAQLAVAYDNTKSKLVTVNLPFLVEIYLVHSLLVRNDYEH